MGNKSFENKLHNASHEYVNGRHYTKPHPDYQAEFGLPPASAYSQDEINKSKSNGSSADEQIGTLGASNYRYIK